MLLIIRNNCKVNQCRIWVSINVTLKQWIIVSYPLKRSSSFRHDNLEQSAVGAHQAHVWLVGWWTLALWGAVSGGLTLESASEVQSRVWRLLSGIFSVPRNHESDTTRGVKSREPWSVIASVMNPEHQDNELMWPQPGVSHTPRHAHTGACL